MESFSETRMEIDLFSDDVSFCPETNIAISKEQIPETTSSCDKILDIRNVNRKVKKKANKPKYKHDCSKKEIQLVQNLEQERSKNRKQKLKRTSERHWDVMAKRSRKFSSRVQKAQKAQNVQNVQNVHKVQKVKRKKTRSKRLQKMSSANSEPIGSRSNPWTKWTTPPPGQ